MLLLRKMRPLRLPIAFLLVISFCTVFIVSCIPMRAQTSGGWIISWGSSQMTPYQGSDETLPQGLLNGATLRQVVHLSTGGNSIRLRFSNTFGSQPLVVHSVHVALQKARGIADIAKAGNDIDTSTDHAVTFNGSLTATAQMGSDILSDPISLQVKPFSDLVVSSIFEATPDAITYHSIALTNSYVLGGDHLAEATFAPSRTLPHWYFLSGVEVAASSDAPGSVVALGDSITDGYGSKVGENGRWTDVLAHRLAEGRTVGTSLSVINEGIGGNRLLEWGLGPTALARFDRDVLAQPGTRYLILFEGVNDLGILDLTEDHSQLVHDDFVASLERALLQIAMKAHEHKIKVFVGTITPYGSSPYYHPRPRSEEDRIKLNLWIRSSHAFDAVIDFDAIVRDPANPDHLLPAYDSGDHIHPGPLGYRQMGDSIPLNLFVH